jgi:hypothetical protein
MRNRRCEKQLFRPFFALFRNFLAKRRNAWLGKKVSETSKQRIQNWMPSAKGEGFEIARSKSVVIASKSEIRLRTAVRRLQRKMHSPAPIESN